MPALGFDCILGGVVRLTCVATITFGKVRGVEASYHGEKFDCDGLVIAYEDEFLPFKEYLTLYAQQHYDEVKHGGTTKQ